MKNNNFRRLKRLGSGNSGDVLLMEHHLNKIRYAVKRITLTNQNFNETQNEVNIQKQIQHPNIIHQYECYQEFNKLCIVMEFADQGDLEKQVQIQQTKNQYFPEKQIWNWFTQICLALQYLHQHHIIHRDIKLSNIFLTKSGLVKIGDFGVAKQLSNTQELASTTLGTPFYVSPEICKGECYSYKSDIWMLGCVLFELCSLDKPFQANSLHALVRKIVEEEPPKLNDEQFSVRCRELVRRLMAKDPQQRPLIEEILQIPEIQNSINFLKQNFPAYQKKKQIVQINNPNFHRLDMKLQVKSFADYLQQVQNKEEDNINSQNQITNYVERFFNSPEKKNAKSLEENQNQNQFQEDTYLKLKSQQQPQQINRNSFESQRKNNYSISYTREKILSNSSDVHLTLHNNLEKKQQFTQSNQKKTLSFHDILKQVDHNPNVFIDDGQTISDFLFNQQM